MAARFKHVIDKCARYIFVTTAYGYITVFAGAAGSSRNSIGNDLSGSV